MGGLRRWTREDREAAQQALSPSATRAVGAGDRVIAEAPDPLRTCFERDRDRIIHSKAFRRLKHKTQVFVNPAGDHTITRLTHTLQVAQVARALAASLALNEPLAEAVALGHDVGHTPFGHVGEDALATFFPGTGWWHSDQSLRIFEVLEPINLCAETRDGIRRHPWRVDPPPVTPEAMCVRFADRIAYLTHDVLDALRAGILTRGDLPLSALDAFGEPGREWINALITGVVEASVAAGEVTMDADLLPVMHDLREFMFARVYLGPEQVQHTHAARKIVIELVEFLLEHPDQISPSYTEPGSDPLTQACDYVAGMTDRYALALHDRWFRPRLFDPPMPGLLHAGPRLFEPPHLDAAPAEVLPKRTP